MPENESMRGGAGPDPAEVAHAAEVVDDVVRAIDRGEVEATSPERAYLVAAATTMRLVAGR